MGKEEKEIVAMGLAVVGVMLAIPAGLGLIVIGLIWLAKHVLG